ncbi:MULTISPECIES: DNA repair and recombination protein RadA [Metallosphaera]|uniref:DNA repair and recombination protein RadA n=3 Tax=Metallosphaera TaxID=41980 RepID=RADA_METS5|nr:MULTISPECIES: DNA repair and recombination protein RadA [Metallosphaera]A4YCN4.1 RecName: Full=DNA repair and recombination protein RadA [Metallosphaera sedula DSM 5348]ABP94186.1 DNA repair and recombination protein RadA [Metallosphaera sedula DSM 5348]AIM26173.1 DNA repair and recombination protein RadA [Metallosphaera sedula]AKV73200.1 DNA repair and recombination protein RadA [Metallosphaera sedula]AKV75444.1 DNA repair and recombination protein RadA [Metallosphaera sedula]AKV77690.1 D
MADQVEEKKRIKTVKDLSGVGQAVLNKLTEAGYSTLESIAVASPQDLSTAAGIPITTAQRIIKEARDALDIRFKTALEIEQERASVKKITTGSQALDGLLGGGIETRTMTELFGEFGSGKTQICHQVSVNVQLPPERGGLSGKALYIDTEGTFRTERIKAMASALGLEPKEVLQNIMSIRAINTDHQIAIVEELQDIIAKDNSIKLVVVDSITSHFRAEYSGRENLAVRQQKLNRHLHQLVRLAEIYDLAVIVTNQVMARPDMFYGDPTVAVGGHTLYHVPGIRVQIKKSRGNRRIARMVDAPHLPEGEVVFSITNTGIRDAEE